MRTQRSKLLAMAAASAFIMASAGAFAAGGVAAHSTGSESDPSGPQVLASGYGYYPSYSVAAEASGSRSDPSGPTRDTTSTYVPGDYMDHSPATMRSGDDATRYHGYSPSYQGR